MSLLSGLSSRVLRATSRTSIRPPAQMALRSLSSNVLDGSVDTASPDFKESQAAMVRTAQNSVTRSGRHISYTTFRMASWTSSDPAALAGVKVEMAPTVTLKYADNTSKNVTLDARTLYDDKSGDPNDLFSVILDKNTDNAITAVRIVPTGNGVGKATLNVSFKTPTLLIL